MQIVDSAKIFLYNCALRADTIMLFVHLIIHNDDLKHKQHLWVVPSTGN